MTDLTELLREMAGHPGLALTLKERRCLREAADALARLRGVEAVARKIDNTGNNAHALPNLLVELREALSGSPPPVRVDDAMVERVARLWRPWCWRELTGEELLSNDYALTEQRKSQREVMNDVRFLLTAAIGGQNG